MKAVTPEMGKVTEAASEGSSPDAEPPGLRPARPGLQPVTDLGTFLQTLPDFGEDADRLLEAVMENRAQRRLEAEERDC